MNSYWEPLTIAGSTYSCNKVPPASAYQGALGLLFSVPMRLTMAGFVSGISCLVYENGNRMDLCATEVFVSLEETWMVYREMASTRCTMAC